MSLAVTVAHAVQYLTRPLATAAVLPAHTLATLTTALETALTNAFSATWGPSPSSGASQGRTRVLAFAPGAAPPRPVYKACAQAGVEWQIWARLLGGFEFELLVDPGCVSVRLPAAPATSAGRGAWSAARVITVWADAQQQQQQCESRSSSSSSLSSLANSTRSVSRSSSRSTTAGTAPAPLLTQAKKTPAQLLIEADAADDDALFSALAAELHAPASAWRTPLVEAFPADAQQLRVPAPTAAHPRRPAMHSRSSSRSSVVSAAPSFLSDDSSVSSCASLSSVASASSSSTGSSVGSSSTRRNRAPRVFIDTSKNEVTPYDGGKTTVLTGGVMLGAAPPRGSRAAIGRRTGRF